MTDLRVVLHTAAPRPTTDVDVAALIATAHDRTGHDRGRRWRRWIAGGLAVFAMGIGAERALAPASHPNRVVETVRERDATRKVDDGRVVDGAPDTPALARRARTEPVRRGFARAPGKSPRRDAPAAASASCDLVGTGHDAPGTHRQFRHNTFLPFGQPSPPNQECTYIAREVQGYIASGSWEIMITRGGHPIEEKDPGYPGVLYGSDMGSPECVPDLIRPGDEVRVRLFDDEGSRAGTGGGIQCL